MKYQFQFAGANVSRRSSPQRKWLRLTILSLAFVLALLAYWQYLQHLGHGAKRAFSAAGKAAATAPSATTATAATAATAAKTTTTTTATAAATTATAAKTAATAGEAPVPSTLKNATDSGVAVVSEAVAKTTTISPVAPAQTVEATPTATAAPTAAAPVATASVAPVAVPVMNVTYEPPKPRPTRELTPQDRLTRAGMTAFGNIMDLASKYPDAYGFGPEDAFRDATLGNPIPVYTIDEADRAAYKSGESVKPLLKPMKTWVFPVCMGDRVCCMVQVNYTGHDYVPGTTSKLLGLAWNKILERWPESEGYHPCIVVNPEIPGYFFTVPELPMPNMTDVIKLSFYHPSLSPADVILASWR